jgi:hypothetical protein
MLRLSNGLTTQSSPVKTTVELQVAFRMSIDHKDVTDFFDVEFTTYLTKIIVTVAVHPKVRHMVCTGDVKCGNGTLVGRQ